MTLFIVFFIFLVFGTPIAFSMGLGGLATVLTSPEFNLVMIPRKLAYGVNTFQLLAIPFFMLAGELMNTAKITDRIFDLSMCFVGHFRGGLGHVNVLGSMIFAGMTGSALADAAGLGRVEIDAMNRAKYDPKFSAAVTAASALIGPIIPPSIPMVLAAALTDTSTGKLLIGGFIPGVCLGLSEMLIVFILAKKRNYPREPRATWNQIRTATKRGFLPMWTPIIIIGGMLSGMFTATEAAAVAVLYALILGCIVYKEIKIKQLWQIIINTGVGCAIILFILCAAGIMTEIITRTGLAQQFLDVILMITKNPTIIFFLVTALFLFLGCFLIDLAIMVMLAPLLAPVVINLGIDPVHFAIVMVVTLMVAMITPPVGSVMYVVCHYTGISIGQFTKEMIPFYLVIFSVIALLIVFPQICLFLPNLLIK